MGMDADIDIGGESFDCYRAKSIAVSTVPTNKNGVLVVFNFETGYGVYDCHITLSDPKTNEVLETFIIEAEHDDGDEYMSGEHNIVFSEKILSLETIIVSADLCLVKKNPDGLSTLENAMFDLMRDRLSREKKSIAPAKLCLE